MSNPSLASMPFLWDPHPHPSSEAAELRHALLCATTELQSARVAAHEELRRMEAQAVQLSQLLDTATRERDELRHQCHALLLLLSSNPHQPQPITSDAGNSTEEDESSNGTSTPNAVSVQMPVPAVPPCQDIKLEMVGLEEMATKKGLPEKGKLVEAVVAAGPLLQTLLLAGPLPKWRHPPPAVRCFDIPLFTPGRELRSGGGGGGGEDVDAQLVHDNKTLISTDRGPLGDSPAPATTTSPADHKNAELGSHELTDGVHNFHFS